MHKHLLRWVGNEMSSLSACLSGIGRAIAYHPKMAKFLGSVNASILFSQLFYWQERTDNELGVFKTAEEWEEETGLTYREQATARKALRERGFLHETHQRLQHRMFFRLDIDAINTAFDGWVLEQNTAERRKRNSVIQPDFPNDESAIREEREAQLAGDVFRNPFNEHRLHTEITTEITETTAVALPVLEQETAAPSSFAGPAGLPEQSQRGAADTQRTRAGELCKLLRRQGLDAGLNVTVQPGNPQVLNWVAAGVTNDEATAACETALLNRRAQDSQQSITAGYLDTIIAANRAAKTGGKNGSHRSRAAAAAAWGAAFAAEIGGAERPAERCIDGEAVVIDASTAAG